MRSIRTFYRQHKVLIFAIATFVVGLISFSNSVIDLLSTAGEKWENLFGTDDHNLVVLRSRLIPLFFVPPTMDYEETLEDNKDLLSLQICIRNYGSKPVLLTSAKLAVTNSKTARVSSVLFWGICMLGENPNEARPIELDPGQEKWMAIAPLLKLPGISNWFTKERLEKIEGSPPPPTAPYTIGPLGPTIKEFNRELANLYGHNAQVNVQLFTSFQTQIRKFTLKLAEGKTIFANDGSLMHDTFIAAWKTRQNGPYVAICSKCNSLASSRMEQ